MLVLFAPDGRGDDGALLYGQVLADGSGQALSSARVELRSAGQLATGQHGTETGENGRYRLSTSGGAAVLRFSVPEYTQAYRSVVTRVGEARRIPDVRLTRRVPVPTFDFRVGTRIVLEQAGTELVIPPGAFDQQTPLLVTPLSAQALPLPLPLGWAPVWAFELQAAVEHLNAPLQIQLSESVTENSILVRFDPEALAWKRLGAGEGESTPAGPVFALTRLATVALVRSDAAPRAPPIPEVGSSLRGMKPVALPKSLRAELTPLPEAVFLQEGGTVSARVELTEGDSLPSGTVIGVERRAVYRFHDGSAYRPEPDLRDLRLYRSDGGLTGIYVAASEAVVADRLREGDVTLHARRPDALNGSVLLGPQGGLLQASGGFRIRVPKGALAEEVPVRLWQASDPPELAEQEYVALDGFVLDLQGAWLSRAAAFEPATRLRLKKGEQLLLFKTVHDGRQSYFELAALPSNPKREKSLGLPGIRSGGQYHLVRAGPTLGFARVRLKGGDGTGGGVLVHAQTLPLARASDDVEATMVIPLGVGKHRLLARQRQTGLRAEAAVVIPSGGQVVDLLMELRRWPLTVASVTPESGAEGVGTGAVVTVHWSEALDTDRFDPASVRLYQGDAPVTGQVELQADGRSLLFRPARLLQETTRYRLEIAAGIVDRYGAQLAGNQADGRYVMHFTTQDNTPPEPPEAGKILAGTPDDQGLARISGSQGTVEAGILVTVRNSATGVTASSQAEGDGSFAVTIAAGLTDDLQMVLLDEGGNEQVLDIGRVTPPPGTAVLDADGGLIPGEQGTATLIPKGLVGPDTVVRTRPIATRGMANPFSKDMPGFIAGAMELDLGGFEVADLLELELSIDGHPNFTTRDRIPLFRIDRELELPADLQPGSRLTVRLKARDQARQSAQIDAEIEIVAQAPEPGSQTRSFDGAPSLRLELPQRASPGQTIRIRARGDPPNIKFRFPANPILTGDEQFLLFAVREVDGKPFWDLADRGALKILEDGTRVIETTSPPYRGIRKDTSQLVMAVFASGSLAFVQTINGTMLTSDLTPSFVQAVDSKGLKGAVGGIANAYAGAFEGFGGLHALGTSVQALTNWPDRNPHEFSVIPVPAGVPAQISVVDQDTNTRIYAADIPALPPGTLSEVLVLGEDDNDLQVTGVVSPANYAVPVDATLAVSFSHLIEPSSITEKSLKILDAAGNQIPASRDTNLDDDQIGFLATITPEQPLATDSRYTLVATRAIRRAGRDPGQGGGLREDFEFPFTTGGALELAGKAELPWAKSFDVADDLLLVSQRAPQQGVNSFVTVDAKDVVKPKILKRTPLDLDRYGPIWSVRLMPDVDFLGRDEQPVKGDLALVSAGNSGTFSTVQVYDVNRPESPRFRSNTMVSVPLDVVQDSAKLLVMPTLSSSMKSDDMSVRQFIGSLDLSWEIKDYFTANIDGIPKTTAYPWKVVTDRDHTVYFINQGIGLMTIDLTRAIPQGTPRTRGERFGPSYIPKDKAGAIVVRDDGGLQTTSPQLAIISPAHLEKTARELVDVSGVIKDRSVAAVHINGFKAALGRAPSGQGSFFTLKDLPLKEGVNELRATAFAANGAELDSIRQLVLRDYASNPLAGPGSVTLSLPSLSVVKTAAVTASAGVKNAGQFDEIWINGQIVAHCGLTAKHMRRTAGDRTARSGGVCEGSGEIPLVPGVNTVVASAINLDEEFPEPYSAADLWVEEGLVLAVQNDLDIFDSTGLVKMGHVAIGTEEQPGTAVRVSVARGVMVDLDDDRKTGIQENEDGDDLTLFDELRNLALLGEVAAKRLTFVDITEPHKAKVLGRIPTEHAIFSAVSLPDEGIAYVAADDALLTIDLTRAHYDGLLDLNGDGRDDRILNSLPVEGGGAQDIRLDAEKGLLYVLQRDLGVLIYRRANACSRDYGVDVTYTPVPREVRFATQDQERLRLLKGLLDGMQSEHCAGKGFELNKNTALLSQGSSACIWLDDGHCSPAYQPGLSDYDFELIVPYDRIEQAKQCAVAMEDAIHAQPGLENADVTVFPIRDTGLKYAYRDVRPVTGAACGGGDDPYGDLCLGRNGNILKWVLEGEWVRSGKEVYNNGFDLKEILATLKRPIFPPVDGKTDPDSERFDPKTGSKVPILDEGGEAEWTHVPRLEGLEWACLEDFALNQSGARIRVKGVGVGDVPIQWPHYLKQLHKVAKAGIRAVYGLLVSRDAGNRHLLGTTRAEYHGDKGCLTRTDKPEEASSLDDFSYKPCEGFSEYIASRALLSAKLKLVDDDGEPLLTEDQALLAYRMYRHKADIGPQIADEQKANQFIIDVLRFIDQVSGDDKVNEVHRKTVDFFTDGDERRQRLSQCEDVHLPKFKPERGAGELRLKVPARLYNSSYERSRAVNLAFYHDDRELARVSCDLQPGESHFLGKKGKLPKSCVDLDPQIHKVVDPDEEKALKKHPLFEIKPELNGIHRIQLLADPDEHFSEYDKANNYDGFYYYLIGKNSDPRPLRTSDVRPPPPKELPDPPASAACLIEARAPPSPRLELIALANRQYETSVAPGAEVDLSWIVRNTGSEDLDGLYVEDSHLGKIDVPALAAGKDEVLDRKLAIDADRDRPVIGISTVRGRDTKANAVGPVSSVVKINVMPPARGNPVVRIYSPPKQDPPFETQAQTMPVWGYVESSEPLAWVKVNDTPVKVAEEEKGLYLFQTESEDKYVPVDADAVTGIEVTAQTRSGGKGVDQVDVVRAKPGKKQPGQSDTVLRVIKRVKTPYLDGWQERVKAKPGDQLDYRILIINDGPSDLRQVTLSDLDLIHPFEKGGSGGTGGPLYALDLPPTAPFDLAAGAREQKDLVYRLPDDAGGGRLANRAYAAGIDSAELPVAASDQAEVLIDAPPIKGDPNGGLTLDPGIVLLRKPSGDPNRPTRPEHIQAQLKVVRVADGVDVTRSADTRIQHLGQILDPDELFGELPAPANPLFKALWNELKTYLTKHIDAKLDKQTKNVTGGVVTPKVPPVAKIELGPDGTLTATGQGVTVIRAVHKPRQGKPVYSNYALVIVGIGFIESIDIQPRSFASFGPQAGQYLTNLLARKVTGDDQYKLLEADIPMFLVPPMQDLSLWQKYVTDNGSYLANWLGSTGFAELTSVKLDFMGGAISGLDILEAARKLLKTLPPVTVVLPTTPPIPVKVPVGWLLAQLVGPAASQMVDFEAEGGAVSIRSSFPKGFVSARQPGLARVIGTLDFSASGFGSAKDDFLAFVGPKLLSTELRPVRSADFLRLAKGATEAEVLVAGQRPGSTTLDLEVREPDQAALPLLGKPIKTVRLKVKIVDPPDNPADALPPIVVDPGASAEVVVPQGGPRRLRVKLLEQAAPRDYQVHAVTGDRGVLAWARASEMTVRAKQTGKVLTFARIGQEEAKTVAGKDGKKQVKPVGISLPSNADLVSYVGGGRMDTYLQSLLPRLSPELIAKYREKAVKAAVPGCPYGGDLSLPLLADRPSEGLDNVSLEVKIGFAQGTDDDGATTCHLLLKSYALGFPAPNLFNEHLYDASLLGGSYLLDDQGNDDHQVAELVDNKGTALRLADLLASFSPFSPQPSDAYTGLTFEREIKGKTPGQVHAGVKTGAFFLGDQRGDTYKPYAGMGGLRVQVLEADDGGQKPPRCDDQVYATLLGRPLDIRLQGATRSRAETDGMARLDIRVVESPTLGELSEAKRKDRSAFELSYRPQSAGIDRFRYKVLEGELESEPCTVRVVVVKIPKIPLPGIDLELPPPFCLPIYAATEKNKPVDVTLLGFTLRSQIPGLPLTELTFDELKPQGAMLKGLLDWFGYDQDQPLPFKGSVEGFSQKSKIGITSVRYVPDQDAFGLDLFFYKVNDGTKDSHYCPVIVDVLNTPVDEPPQALSENLDCSARDAPVKSLLGGTDPEGEQLEIEVAPGGMPTHGKIVEMGPVLHAHKHSRRELTYLPDEGFSGADNLVFVVKDPKDNIDAGYLGFKVNEPPVCTEISDKIAIDADEVRVLPIFMDDPDDCGDRLEPKIHRMPTKGVITALAKDSISFRPFKTVTAGSDSFSYVADDGLNRSEPCEVSVVIEPNEPPEAIGRSVVVQKSSQHTDPRNRITLAADDEPSQNLSFQFPGSSTRGGGLRGAQRTSAHSMLVTYAPPRDYAGLDDFRFVADDGKKKSSPATVSIRVNAPPVARPDYASTKEDVPVVVEVLANDEDPDGKRVRLDRFDAVAYGASSTEVADISREGDRLRVAPRPHYDGELSFTYQILDSDDAPSEQPGLVSVTVVHVNHPPKAKDDQVTTDEDEPVEIDVLANDSDPDEDDELYIDRVSRARHGQVTNRGGKVGYEPEASWSGEDGFRYTVRDPDGEEAGAEVAVTVKPVNDPPFIPDQEYFLWCCEPVELKVLEEASDPDSKINYASLSVVQRPHRGEAEARPRQADVRYTPNLAYRGNTEMQVTVSDQQGAVSSPAKITLTIGAVAGMINEIVPSESKVELFNPGPGSLDISGWTLAGYHIGSQPGRESYSSPSDDRNVDPATRFPAHSHLVVTLPGTDLRFGRIELRDAGGRLREVIEPDRSCYQQDGSGARALARRWDGFAANNACLELHWVGRTSLGEAN